MHVCGSVMRFLEVFCGFVFILMFKFTYESLFSYAFKIWIAMFLFRRFHSSLFSIAFIVR